MLTMNLFAVSRGGPGLRIGRAISSFNILTPDEALNLAAWLVAIAEHEASQDFDELLEAVKNT